MPVVGVTFGCCLLAIRWAEDQFNRESVLFRESERLDLGRWLTHLFRDRADTPTLAQAILCIVVVSIVQFFVSLSLSAQGGAGSDFHSLAQLFFISQVVCIALPAGLMTLLFTRKPARTLLLDRWPRISHVLAAAVLALLMFPLGGQLGQWIEMLYPVSNEVKEQIVAFSATMQTAPNWWLPLLLIGCAAGDLRRARLSRIHPVWLATLGTQMVGDQHLGDRLRHGPLYSATKGIGCRTWVGHRHTGCPDGKPCALHGVSRLIQQSHCTVGKTRRESRNLAGKVPQARYLSAI